MDQKRQKIIQQNQKGYKLSPTHV